MPLTAAQTLITILAIALGTMLTRFTPFIIFPEGKKTPKTVLYLGKVLPPAMMGLLVVYCLKAVSITAPPHGLSELLSILLIIVLHKWKNNVLLSVGAGTALYMICIRLM